MAKKTSGLSSISDSWKRLETWLRDNAPASLTLPPGASEEQIRTAEREIGVRFPDDLRVSYLLHDGSNRIWLSSKGYLMPLFKPQYLPKRKQALFNEVVESWKFMTDMLKNGQFEDPGFRSQPVGPIKPDWWNAQWVPITYNESGDHVCIDMSPAKGGGVGQVIDWWHERGATSALAGNFSEWLEQRASEFEQGACRFDEGTGTVVFS
jgi:cell wall assembly regulator SMI1